MGLPFLLSCILVFQAGSKSAPAPRPLVAAGGYHSFALDSQGQFWGWGANERGQLGDESTVDRPVPVRSHTPGERICAIAAGEAHSFFITEGGRVFACGQNDHGQLGTGTTESSPRWIEVKAIDHVLQIAAGRNHSFALRDDGTVWGWGDNQYAQIKEGGAAQTLVPTLIPRLRNIRQIASGATHGLALTSHGELWAWGDGRRGQLGPGRIGSAFLPAVVKGLGHLRQIAAGDEFSLALLAEGTVPRMGPQRAWAIG